MIPLTEIIAGGATFWPSALAFNAAHNRLYVYGNLGWIAVLDCATNRIAREMPISELSGPALWVARNDKAYFQSLRGLVVVGGSSDSIEATLPLAATAFTFDDEHNCLVVACPDSFGLLFLIDGATNAVRSRLNVNGYPQSVVWSQENDCYYVEYEGRVGGSYWLEVIAAGSGTPVDSVRLPPTGAQALAFTPGSNKVYVGYDSLLVVIDAGTNRFWKNLRIRALGLLWNSLSNRLYCLSESTVVLDCATDTVFARLRLGRYNLGGVHGVLDSRNGKLAFEDSDGVVLFDAAADTLLAHLRFSSDLENDMAVDSLNGRMYVATKWPDMVRTIDVRDNALSDSTSTSVTVSGVVFNPLVDKLYAQTYGFGGRDGHFTNTVNVIDPVEGRVVGQLRTGTSEWTGYECMCLDPTGQKLYCPNSYDNYISVIDCQRGEIVGAIPVPPKPSWLAVNSQDRKLYCAHLVNDAVLTVIDCNADTVVASVPFPGPFLRYVVWHEGVDKLYAVNEAGMVSVVDGGSNRVIKTFQLPAAQLCPPACDLTDNRLYVAALGSPALYAVDAEHDSVLDSLPQLSWGSGPAWNRSSNKVFFLAEDNPPGNGAGVAGLACDRDSFLGYIRGSTIGALSLGCALLSHSQATRAYFSWESARGDSTGIGTIDCDQESLVGVATFPARDYPQSYCASLALDEGNCLVFEAGRTHIYCVRDELPAVTEGRSSRGRQSLELACSVAVTRRAVRVSAASSEPVVATMTFYDFTGRVARAFVPRRVDAQSEWLWDLADCRGLPTSSGVYFCRLRATSLLRSAACCRTLKLTVTR